MEYKVEFVSIDELRPYLKNAKNHPQSQVDAIKNSIREFGFRQNLVIDENGVIIIGHGRFEAARQLGIEYLPCIRANDLTDEQIRALRLADNKVAESDWDMDFLNLELNEILELDMSNFGFDLSTDEDDEPSDERAPSCQHNVFENQEVMQFPMVGKYGIPEMEPTQTVGDKLYRFCDFNELKNPGEYIAHFYYDDYKFISAWREPNKYLNKLRQFKAVVAPDFSLYTDFPIALQILSCYRRQWCAAYWQYHGIDVIPDVVWGERESFEFCFDGIPKHSTVAVSTVGVKRDKEWNNDLNSLFKTGYDEMMNRLEPKGYFNKEMKKAFKDATKSNKKKASKKK